MTGPDATFAYAATAVAANTSTAALPRTSFLDIGPPLRCSSCPPATSAETPRRFASCAATGALASVTRVREGPFMSRHLGRRLLLAALLLALTGVAAACGGAAPDNGAPAPQAPLRPPRSVLFHRGHHVRRAHVRGPVRLVVTVIDGDRWRRVPGARVHLWHRKARTDRHGIAEIRVPRRKPVYVTLAARGFGTRTLRVTFAKSRRVTLRVYRRDLQWPLYGATASRTQAQTHIRLRPPFRTVWARNLHALIEFPAAVDSGVAYIGNARATVRAIKTATGTVLWRHDTPHGKMASSPAVVGRRIVYHSMEGHVFVLDRASGRLRWSYWAGAPIESSPIVRDGVDYF